MRTQVDRLHHSAGSTSPAQPDGVRPPESVPTRLRVLHLAFEDHRRPGSGGGAARTHEINRRLAVRHDVTVVTARYPGCVERVEDGVRYVHIGLSLGYFGSILTYFMAIPLALWRHRSDLVVEDFAAPFSSALVPLWTRRPVVGMVQWLFAREKSRQYRLPFFVIEEIGVRLQRRMIAVSGDLAERLRSMNRRARIDVIPNGVDPEARECRWPSSREHILYLGRIEIAQKGLDMLLKAYATVAPFTAADLLIAGDGPDSEALRALSAELGLGSRVRFLGRVSGPAKYELLSSAALLCMPSRYETFGMVALEALACGTPVLAFDIPCLREIIPTDCGVLVPGFDVEALGASLRTLIDQQRTLRTMGDAGREMARRFDWDGLALRQEMVYLEAVGSPPVDAGITPGAPV
jgi:glycosyltransferase involved in cell wall biosynthesis